MGKVIVAFPKGVTLASFKKADNDYSRLHVAADGGEAELEAAFIRAVLRLQNSIVLGKIEEALASGNPDAVVAAIPWDKMTSSYGDTTRETFLRLIREGALASDMTLPEGTEVRMQRGKTAPKGGPSLSTGGEDKKHVNFNALNDRAVLWAEQHSSDLITEVENQTKLAVRDVVTRGFTEGMHPHKQAIQIRDFVGLNRRLQNAVLNYHQRQRVILREQNPKWTWDQVDEKARERSNRYFHKLLVYRGRNIARTETMTASNQGRLELWQQAEEQGVIDRSRATLKWRITPDDRLCRYCMAMAGDAGEVPYGQMFQTPKGPKKAPPMHPMCRCVVSLVFGRHKQPTFHTPSAATMAAVAGGVTVAGVGVLLAVSPAARAAVVASARGLFGAVEDSTTGLNFTGGRGLYSLGGAAERSGKTSIKYALSTVTGQPASLPSADFHKRLAEHLENKPISHHADAVKAGKFVLNEAMTDFGEPYRNAVLSLNNLIGRSGGLLFRMGRIVNTASYNGVDAVNTAVATDEYQDLLNEYNSVKVELEQARRVVVDTEASQVPKFLAALNDTGNKSGPVWRIGSEYMTVEAWDTVKRFFPGAWTSNLPKLGEILGAVGEREDSYYEPVNYQGTKTPATLNLKHKKGKVGLGTSLHEFTHMLEDANPDIYELEKSFWESRTWGEETIPLDGYGHGVVGRKDRFFDPYVGRYYKDFKGMEILSTAVERIFGENGFYELALDRSSPLTPGGHYDFSLGMLSGHPISLAKEKPVVSTLFDFSRYKPQKTFDLSKNRHLIDAYDAVLSSDLEGDEEGDVANKMFDEIVGDDALSGSIKEIMEEWTGEYSTGGMQSLMSHTFTKIIEGEEPDNPDSKKFISKLIAGRKDRWKKAAKKIGIPVPNKFVVHRGIWGTVEDYDQDERPVLAGFEFVRGLLKSWYSSGEVSIPADVLASWTLDKGAAKVFANGESGFTDTSVGAILTITVPIEATLLDRVADSFTMWSQYPDEYEIIVASHPGQGLRASPDNFLIRIGDKWYNRKQVKSAVKHWVKLYGQL